MISEQPLLFPSDWHFPHNLSEVQGLKSHGLNFYLLF